MSEKYYTLGTHTAAQWTELHAEIIADGNVYASVPSREITVEDEKLHSPTRGSYLLTLEEATALKSDERVKFINESPEKYPEKYMVPPEEMFDVTNNTLTDRWPNAYNNYQVWLNNPNFSNVEPTINRTTALYRMQTKQNPWITIGYPTATDDTRISHKLQQVGAGENVDIIIADNGTWIGHTEFINSGVTNAVNPTDYVGGNVLPGNGSCDCLDLVLDAPYYLDPDWFNAAPGSRLETRWDGTTVPVESVARSWWSNSSQRSARFQNTGADAFGQIPVNYLYTRDRANGSNTTLPRQSTLLNGTHGTQCASLAFGRTHGWAYNANKWILNLIGYYNVGGPEVGFDLQKVFHQYKPVNSTYGTKNPTISSNSWSFKDNSKSGTHYYWRTDAAVAYDGISDEPEFISWLGYYNNGLWATEMLDNSMTQAGDELTQAGVIFVCSAGNNNQQQVNPDHPNYDNRIANNNTGGMYDSANKFIFYNREYTGSTNRRGYPQHIGKTESQTAYGNTTVKFPAINVGALSSTLFGLTSYEAKVHYSSSGSAIDVFAPGDGTLAATAGTFGTDVARLDASYSGLAATWQVVTTGTETITACRDARFGGTSASTPITAGFLALVMQYNRGWTYEEVRNWIKTNVQVQSTTDMYEGTEPTSPTANWLSAATSLRGADRRVLYQATIPWKTYTLDLGGIANINEGSNLTVTLTTANIIDNTTVPYTISGTGITTSDIGNNALTGNFTVTSNTATLILPITSDATTEGLETITIALDNGESSVSVNINDTSVAAAPSYTLDLDGIASINEGSNLTVTLTTANVTDNTTVPYTISGTGITTSDINGNALTGNFTVTSNTATLILPITSDATTESLETITIALDNGESSVSVNINDTSVAATQYNLVTGNLITAAQYNLLRAQLEDVLHDMYGQTSSIWQLPSTSNFVNTVSTGQTIGKAAYNSVGAGTYISEIEKIYLSIARAHYHQTGVLPTNLIVPLTGYTYGADATSASFSGHIDNITKENPGKVTTLVPHGLQNGMTVNIDGVVGMTNVNNSQFTVTVVDETNFTIGVDTVNYPRHESRGTFTITNANISNSDQFGYNDYLSAINTIRTYALISQNYILPINNANNYSLTTLNTSYRTTAWGDSVDIITHEVTVTFNTVANRTRTSYFEAGGEIRFSAAIGGGTNTAGTKYASWSGLIASISTVKFGRDNTSNGNVTLFDGYNDLTATYKEIFRADAGAGVYAENDYNIQAKLVDSNKIQFLIEFRDDDAGDQTGTGSAVDENVGGTTISTVSAYVPDSSFTYNGSTITAVYFPDPTCVVDSALE